MDDGRSHDDAAAITHKAHAHGTQYILYGTWVVVTKIDAGKSLMGR